MKQRHIVAMSIIFIGAVFILAGFLIGSYGFGRLSREDCTSLEQYDTLRGECYFDCETDAECEDIARKVEAELDAYFENSKSIISNTKPTAPTQLEAPSINTEPEAEESNEDQSSKLYSAEETGSEVNGKIYTITSSQELYPSPNATDQKLWELFRKIASNQIIAERLETFEVFSDEGNDTAASVWESNTPGKWHMNVNSSFADDRRDLIHTMVHEYGHILTLNATQVDKTVGSCPQITIPEGCVKSGTILNSFHEKFWSQYGIPFDETGEEASAPYSEEEFVTDYAASNVIEDLAESFAYFVLRPRPTSENVKDQKLQLFYSYPEYVAVRNQIRANLAGEI